MNRDEFEGSWHEIKGKIREKWGKFTNDDIARMNGKFEQFMGQLQKKYGYSKEQAEQEMRNWQSGHQHSGNEQKPSSPNPWKSNENKDHSQCGPNCKDPSHQSKGQGMNKNKKRDDDQGFKDKNRKVG